MSVTDQLVVMLPTNATNKGNPELRAYVVNPDFIMNVVEEFAADMVAWLAANGITAEVVTLDRYHEKLQNYRERVGAAS